MIRGDNEFRADASAPGDAAQQICRWPAVRVKPTSHRTTKRSADEQQGPNVQGNSINCPNLTRNLVSAINCKLPPPNAQMRGRPLVKADAPTGLALGPIESGEPNAVAKAQLQLRNATKEPNRSYRRAQKPLRQGSALSWRTSATTQNGTRVLDSPIKACVDRELSLGFYPVNADTFKKADDRQRGVSCPSEENSATSSSVRQSA